MSPIDHLSKTYPSRPNQGAVGRIPKQFLDLLPKTHIDSLRHRKVNLNALLTRSEVRGLCRDTKISPLAKYACVMAWGGQHPKHFKTSIQAKQLVPLIKRFLRSSDKRVADFVHAQQACKQIKGLKISFYTKLLFFMRRKQDGYILDQWTAKSINCLASSPVIRLTRPNKKGECRAVDDTSPDEYEKFCQSVEQLPTRLWLGQVPAATAEDAEMAIFDKPRGPWRRFVQARFLASIASSLGESPRRRSSSSVGRASVPVATACSGVGSVGANPKSALRSQPIYLQANKSFTKIVSACGDRPNLGLITKAGELWLKADERPEKRYLISEIIAAGGPDLPNKPRFIKSKGGATSVGGSGFQGGVSLGSPDNCRQFLKLWFIVHDCP